MTPTPSFTDRTGREWPLLFTVNLIDPLTAALGHNPRALLADPDKLLALLCNPVKLVAATRVLTSPDAATVPDGEFTALFDADALDQAAAAVIRAVASLYAPRGRAGEVADAIIGTLTEAGKKIAELNASAEPVEGPTAAV